MLVEIVQEPVRRKDGLFPSRQRAQKEAGVAQELARDQLIPIGAVLTGPHWPGPVRVVRVAPRGSCRVTRQGWHQVAESAADYEIPSQHGSG